MTRLVEKVNSVAAWLKTTFGPPLTYLIALPFKLLYVAVKVVLKYVVIAVVGIALFLIGLLGVIVFRLFKSL